MAKYLDPKNDLTFKRVFGEQIGMEKGKSEEKKDTIINSHRAGIPAETIAVITNLTVEQVLKIIKDASN
jgi:hypothetical protein